VDCLKHDKHDTTDFDMLHGSTPYCTAMFAKNKCSFINNNFVQVVALRYKVR